MTYRHIATVIDKQLFGFVIPKIQVPKWLARLGAFFLSKLRKHEFYQPWMIEFAQEHYHFDLQELHQQLNWTPVHRLKEELPALIQNAQEKPKEWHRRNEMRPWHMDDWPKLDKLLSRPAHKKTH